MGGLRAVGKAGLASSCEEHIIESGHCEHRTRSDVSESRGDSFTTGRNKAGELFLLRLFSTQTWVSFLAKPQQISGCCLFSCTVFYASARTARQQSTGISSELST